MTKALRLLKTNHENSLDGTMLTSTEDLKPISLPLSALMPGLGKAMLGMKEKEKRLVFIHPEYGHIDIPSLEGHPVLVVEVQLDEIVPHSTQKFDSEPIYFEISEVLKDELEKKYRAAHLKLAYQYGKAVWGHYKWGEPDYTLNEIVGHLNRTSKKDCKSPSSQKLLDDLHWSIYQKQEGNHSSVKLKF